MGQLARTAPVVSLAQRLSPADITNESPNTGKPDDRKLWNSRLKGPQRSNSSFHPEKRSPCSCPDLNVPQLQQHLWKMSLLSSLSVVSDSL